MKKEDVIPPLSSVFEGMTSISALLNTSQDINDRRIEKILIDQTKRRSKSAEIGFLVAKSHELGFPIEFVSSEVIQATAQGTSHGGILAICSDRTIPTLCAEMLESDGFYVYMEGLEDPYNFGNAIRSLYAAGVTGIILPPRNWLSASGVVARASAGASERLPMMVAEPDTLVHEFKKVGYHILCAGIRNSVSIYEESISLPLLLIIGGEKRGISATLLEKADQIVRIDYGRSFRGSLSTSASAAVLAFEIMRKNKEKQA